jgi:hypothetical protein
MKMKRIIAPALSLLAIITPGIAQPADVALRFDCSAFTHILYACLPPSAARDSANAMASAFMSEAIRLGRERHMSDGKLNTVAMAALQRQRAKTGNSCSRLDVLRRNLPGRTGPQTALAVPQAHAARGLSSTAKPRSAKPLTRRFFRWSVEWRLKWSQPRS